MARFYNQRLDFGSCDGYATTNADAIAFANKEFIARTELGVENVKRLVRPPSSGADGIDWLSARSQSPYHIGEFVEIKTVWHPIGA